MSIRRAVLVLFFGAATADGQTLDVGGFDLRIGESFDGAVRRLSSVYEVQYLGENIRSLEGAKMWFIKRRGATPIVIGRLNEMDGKLVRITRDWAGEHYELPRAFVRWLEEAERRSGVGCTTFPDFTASVNGSREQLTSYTTRCGRYELSHGIVNNIGGDERYAQTRESLKLSVR